MPRETKKAEMVASVRDRAEMYRLLAQVYFKPLSQEQIDALAQADLAALAVGDASPFAKGSIFRTTISPSCSSSWHACAKESQRVLRMVVGRKRRGRLTSRGRSSSAISHRGSRASRP